MGLFLRIIIVWAILSALGYTYGLPYIAKQLQLKTQSQILTQCSRQLADQHLTSGPKPQVSQVIGDKFCHCLADPITLRREDLIESAVNFVQTGKRLPPPRLAKQMQEQVQACNNWLQQAIIPAAAPVPRQAMPLAPRQQSETIIFK